MDTALTFGGPGGSVNRRYFIEGLSAAWSLKLLEFSAASDILNSGVAAAMTPPGNTYPAPIPIPTSVETIVTPEVNLAGRWLFDPLPLSEFWKQDLGTSKWLPIEVPNEFEMIGHPISPNTEYPCGRTIQIPREFNNHRIFIRFDGVYSYARVWVNGIFVRDHSGGFTSWDADITDHVKPGTSAQLVVGVTDQADNISQGSYYAKHSIAGILRNVRMCAVPRSHLSSLAVNAQPDRNGDGVISVAAALSSSEVGGILGFTLRDASGQPLPFDPPSEIKIFSGKSLTHQIHVRSPKLWDCEHPHLYRLEITLRVSGQPSQTLERNIGFRSVERRGNQLLVNGQPVKLHGACRHSIHPLYGRAVPAEFDEKDAVLFREANVNFVRTSHYPPTEAFLEACDRHGIYVEEETPVCWSRASSSNSNLREQYLGQFREMITRDQHHACVLFWSLGNESEWGSNIAAEREYAETNDPGRPLIFSYPDTVPMGTKGYDIYSKHYADVNSNLQSPEYPLLNDEFAHVSCYNLDTLRRDPGVRNFWGESIKRFGDSFLAVDGCLGGSIWAGIDEVFLLPAGPIGYGEWGIIDGWRRRKPEHWLTRKAYSPIRIDESASLPLPHARAPLSITVQNAFNHTNLKDIEIAWSIGLESGRLSPVDIPPHRSGVLQIPGRLWQAGEKLRLDFRAPQFLVEQVELTVGTKPRQRRSAAGGNISLTEDVNDYAIGGPQFSVVLSKQTGLITQALWKGEPILQGGPFLDVGTGALTTWLPVHSQVRREGNRVIVLTAGETKAVEGIDGIPVQFEIEIDGDGCILTRYRAQVKSGSHPNLGIAYLLPDSFEKLAWNRRALWSRYPDDHIGRPEGVAMRHAPHPLPEYRDEPAWPWSQDMTDPFVWGKSAPGPGATNDFRSLKTDIWWASVSTKSGKARVHTEADGDAAVRASLQRGSVCLSIYDYWSYPDLAWGNYTGVGASPAVATLERKIWLLDGTDEQH